ncbi:MAG: type II secretion system minor pseudopilin GspH [Rudaea sp.]
MASPIPDSRFPIRGSRGFTLIELLVVVVIVAVMAGALTLAIGGVGGERKLAYQAEQTQALIRYACEQAELTGRSIGLSLKRDGYRFSQFERQDWVAFGPGELRARNWLDTTNAFLSRDGRRVTIAPDYPEKPQLVCFSSGELTPFVLDMTLSDLPIRYRLDGQPDGDIKIASIDDRAR